MKRSVKAVPILDPLNASRVPRARGKQMRASNRAQTARLLKSRPYGRETRVLITEEDEDGAATWHSSVPDQTGSDVETIEDEFGPPPLVRSVSPTFGGLMAVSSFDTSNGFNAAETWRYECLHLLPNFMSSGLIATRFQVFCQRPVIFRAFSYSAAVHHDIGNKQISKSQTHAAIAHKLAVFQMVNALISTFVRTHDMDTLTLLLMILAPMFPRPTQAQLDREDKPHLLSPHIPTVICVNVYGQLEVDSAQENAVIALVQWAGGLDNLQLPGLAQTTASLHLLKTSVTLKRPTLPRPWKVNPVAQPTMLSNGRMLGQGFVDVLSRLPPELVTPFVNLAFVDDALAQTRYLRPGDTQSDYFRDLLHDAHHRVMSLPPFEAVIDEQAIDDGGRQAAAYELCRLAATIYSCAVILPLPTVSGWHLELCARLRSRMQLSNTKSWPQEFTSMLVWVLMVTNMAAFHYNRRDYFLDALQKRLNEAGLTTWPAVRMMLERFAWSDAGCADGAVVVWDLLRAHELPREAPSLPRGNGVNRINA